MVERKCHEWRQDALHSDGLQHTTVYTLTKLCNKFKEKGVVLHRDRVRVDFMCFFISENISFID